MKKLFCYSHNDFDAVMSELGASREYPVHGISTISIVSEFDSDSSHFFSDTVNTNINLDFCDIDPQQWWKEHPTDMYDMLLDEYIRTRKDDMNPDANKFSHLSEDGNVYYAMNYEQADKLVRFIDEAVKRQDHIYVHCSAGKSRSQGVVRFILDSYSYGNVKWKTRIDNPCITPNWHVVSMLSRVCYNMLF